MSKDPTRLVAIRCPGCNKVVAEVIHFATSYYDPNFNHKCGYKKPLYWSKNKAAKSANKAREKAS